MKHEKVFKRKDGTAVKVTVTLNVPYTGDEFTYWVNVRKREYRARKWEDSSRYAWPKEIHAVKTELWEKLKPQI